MLFHTELLYLLKIKDKNKIMILTGKAKEDFYKYINIEDYKLFDYVRKKYANEIVLNALIIEWFDSVGIYVNAELDYLHIVWFPTINNDWNFEEREFETRQEAIKEAIKKANEIYNTTL